MTNDYSFHKESNATLNPWQYSTTPPFQSAPTTVSIFIQQEVDLGYFLDDTTDWILQIVTIVVLGLICGLFGTITNIINIFVFIKQGLFSGGSVLNLFALAIADLGVTFTYFLHGIGFAVIVARLPDLPIEPFSIVYLSFGWPHVIFVKINRILTAFVAFERCMCVVIPFRVKNMFAPRRCLVYVIILFAYGFLSHLPVYLTHSLGDVQQRGTNITKIDLVYGTNREFWHDLVYYGNFLALSFVTTIIVIVCTVVTSAYIRTSKEWRDKMSDAKSVVSTNKTGGNQNSKPEKNNKQVTKGAMDKEARVVKMITAISTIFCICYIPELFLIVLRSVDPRINTTGQYERLSRILYGLTFFTGAVNSSINIFVYYRMSSKYREIFLSYFGSNKE